MSGLLTLLIGLPLAAALGVWFAPDDRARPIALGGAAATFGLALWGWLGAADAPDLRTTYATVLIEDALDRRGVDDPLHRAELGRLLREPALPFEVAGARLRELVDLRLAAATLRDVTRLYPEDTARQSEVRDRLREAGLEAAALVADYAALERELGPARRVALSPAGTRVVHVTRVPWIPALGIHYHVGLDGLSAPLVTLTAFLGLLGLLAAAGPSARPRVLAASLALEGGLLLLYLALDLVMLYLAWTLLVIPLWALLAADDSERRAAVGVQAALPTLTGAALLLLVCVGVARLGGDGQPVFDVLDLGARAGRVDLVVQALIFAGVLAAAAPRLPVAPLHGWLRRVCEGLPGPAAVLVLGAGLPAGGFLLARLGWPLAPDVVSAITTTPLPTAPLLVAALGLAGVFFGASLALGERSAAGALTAFGVAGGGWTLLGLVSLTPQGWGGAALWMVTLGLAGAVIALAREAGAADDTVRPALGLGLLALAGAPGLAGFPALLSIVAGLADSPVLGHPWLPARWACYLALAGWGLSAFAAVRWLRAPARAERGGGRPAALAALVPALVALVLLGLWPRFVLDAVAVMFGGLVGVGP